VERLDGVRVAYRSVGSGPVHLVLLHGTLSTAGQLASLARTLAETGRFTVLAVDRRGSGGSRLADPSPLGVDVHVADVAAVLDAEACRSAVLVGVSFGGVVALEFAARMPDRTLAVVAYEPPYGPVADADTQRAFAVVAAATERAYRTGEAPAAAEAFMLGVAGARAWDRLPERTQAFLAAEGAGAYVDAGLQGLDPSGLARIRVPVTLLTGGASESFYGPIVDALLERIPASRHRHLPGLTHAAPITDPTPIAEAVRAALVASEESDA
jgi:pimeloyl-ACP methyl ester carboxylesterase